MLNIKKENFEYTIRYMGEDKFTELIDALKKDSSPLVNFVIDKMENMADVAMFGENFESQTIGSCFFTDLCRKIGIEFDR